MARIVTGFVVALAVLGFAFAGTAQADDKTDLQVFWKKGINFASCDGKFKAKIGGRIQIDYWGFDDDNLNLATNGNLAWNAGGGFRRVRLYTAGTAYKYAMWKLSIDFTGVCDNDREVEFADVYIGLTNLGDCFGCLMPDLYIGHFKQFFSLEALTSSRHTTFMERALPVCLFAPIRDTGLGLYRDFFGGRMTLGLGVFGHNVDDCGDILARQGYDISARLTGILWGPCNCPSSYLHLGASILSQNDINAVQYRCRPEVALGSNIVDTGAIATDSALVYGGEMAFNYNSFHLAGEYIGVAQDSPVLGDPAFFGYYVEASWTFGGYRPMNRNYATMAAVKPCQAWLDNNCCGWGAWELAARYSFADLTDGAVVGGEASDITVGINWYLNENAKIMLNYVLSNLVLPGVDESMNAFGIRFQVWF